MDEQRQRERSRALRAGWSRPALARLGVRRLVRGAAAAALIQLASPAGADSILQAVPGEPERRVAEILEQIKARYAEPIDDNKLVADAVNGVLKNLDPHSVYLDAKAFRELQMESRGEYGGVGIEVAIDGRAVKVLATLENTPASRAGLRAGDVFVRIGDTGVDGMSLEQVTRRVRGEPDTDVTLTIVRAGEPGPRSVTLTRETIQGRSVKADLIEPGYAYVRLTQFQRNTARAMAQDLERLMEGSAVTGIILDLRDNPGGVLSAAVGVSAAFLEPGAPVVFSDGTGSGSKMRLFAKRADYLRNSTEDYLEALPPLVKTLPMVVLVNGESASAAEIVAGALQDNKRATILGTRTYGKGSIQTVIPFGDGTGMKLTTAHYFTPSGRVIQGKGVMPDIVVEEKFAAQADAAPAVQAAGVALPVTGSFAQTIAAICVARSDVDAKAVPDVGRTDNPPHVMPSSGDCQLEHALHLLRSLTSITKS
jgi:carboxyl-terminal processing protease